MPAKRRRRRKEADLIASPPSSPPLLSTVDFPDEQHGQTATQRALLMPEIVHEILMWMIAGHYKKYRPSGSVRSLFPAFPKAEDVSITEVFVAKVASDQSLRLWKPKRDWLLYRKIRAIWRYALVNHVWLGEVLRFMWRRPTKDYGRRSIVRLLQSIKPERRDVYADMIQISALNTVPDCQRREANAVVRGLTFDNLRHLKLTVHCWHKTLRGSANIPRVRCPNVIALEMRGGSFSPVSNRVVGSQHEWLALFKSITVRQVLLCLRETTILVLTFCVY